MFPEPRQARSVRARGATGAGSSTPWASWRRVCGREPQLGCIPPRVPAFFVHDRRGAHHCRLPPDRDTCTQPVRPFCGGRSPETPSPAAGSVSSRSSRILTGVNVAPCRSSVPGARSHLRDGSAEHAYPVPWIGEFSHVHPSYDGSLHLAPPPDLAADVSSRGWGRPHLRAGNPAPTRLHGDLRAPAPTSTLTEAAPKPMNPDRHRMDECCSADAQDRLDRGA